MEVILEHQVEEGCLDQNLPEGYLVVNRRRHHNLLGAVRVYSVNLNNSRIRIKDKDRDWDNQEVCSVNPNNNRVKHRYSVPNNSLNNNSSSSSNSRTHSVQNP